MTYWNLFQSCKAYSAFKNNSCNLSHQQAEKEKSFDHINGCRESI